MNQIILFTHIPKTAGTSFLRGFDKDLHPLGMYAFQGFKKFLFERPKDASVIYGHVPYGLHLLLPGSTVKYITWLRNPIDRAVSEYYFIKKSDPKKWKHPLRDRADQLSLAEFYQDKTLQNMQTRYIAGIANDQIYPWLPECSRQQMVLDVAIRHLEEKYACFGILERMSESLAIFADKFNWSKWDDPGVHKQSVIRPRLAELDENTAKSLQNSHQLDLALYDFAVSRFEKQSRSQS